MRIWREVVDTREIGEEVRKSGAGRLLKGESVLYGSQRLSLWGSKCVMLQFNSRSIHKTRNSKPRNGRSLSTSWKMFCGRP